jgi:hypothetical protein
MTAPLLAIDPGAWSVFVPGVPVAKGSARAFVVPGTGRAIVTQTNRDRQRPWSAAIHGAAVDAMRHMVTVHCYGRAAFGHIANWYEPLYRRFCYYLREHYLLPTNPFSLDADGNRQAVDRLRAIARGERPWLTV